MMFKYLYFKLLTFSHLILIQITGTGRQTDWPNFGMSSETNWALQLEKTNIIVQVVSLLIVRMYSDLKSHISVIILPATTRLDLAHGSPEVVRLVASHPVVIAEVDLKVGSSFPRK